MLIHADRRRMLREFLAISGKFSAQIPQETWNTRLSFHGYDKRAITYLGKCNLQGTTSRRYANSVINPIFAWNDRACLSGSCSAPLSIRETVALQLP
jgi:hypothetical protein